MDHSYNRGDVKPEIERLQRQFHLNQHRKEVRSSSSSHTPVKTDPDVKRKQLMVRMRNAMPNLLKSVGDSKTTNKCLKMGRKDDDFSVNHMPTDNVFLRKYDPIKLLGRLRSSLPPPGTVPKSSVLAAGESRKVLTCETLPSKSLAGSWNRRVKQGGNKLPCSKKYKLTCNKGRAAGVIMKSRKRPVPKHSKRFRKQTLWYKCVKKGIPGERMRMLAAVYLKRGLDNVRNRGTGKDRILQKTPLKVKRPVPPLKFIKPVPPLIPSRDITSSFAEGIKRKHQYQCQTDSDHSRRRNVALPLPLSRRSVQFTVDEDPSIMHTINLLRHKRELQDRLDTMESEGVIYKLSPTPEKVEVNGNHSEYLYANVKLTTPEVKQILSERLLVSLAHAGFTHTKVRPLEVLTDFVSNFLTNITKRLKAVTEIEMTEVDHGFTDPMESVLTDMGLGGVRGLEDFYRSNVVDYEKRMEEQCQTFRRQYAHKVRSMIGLTNSTTSSTDGTGGTNGVTGNCSRTVAISTSNAGSNSTTITPSIPLSPGNSVLAEILSSQEQNHSKSSQGSPQPSTIQPSGMEKQSTGVPPPNVVIRPNMIFSNNTPQHTQMVLQTLTSLQSPPVKSMQPHLTQLLQRPINTSHMGIKKGSTYTHQQQISHVSQQPTQFQGMMQPQQGQASSPATPSPSGSHEHSSTMSSDLNHLLINVNTSKVTSSSTMSSERQAATHLSSEASFKANKNKTVTLVRSTSNPSSGITINSDRQFLHAARHSNSSNLMSNNSPIDLYSDLTNQLHGSPTIMHHHPRQSNNNVISINLSGLTNIDLDNSGGGGMQDETVTMHVAEAVSQSNFSPSVKLKDPHSGQRNLLRLNFEQAPTSGGESTVLLSSSPANQSDPNDSSFIPVQFF